MEVDVKTVDRTIQCDPAHMDTCVADYQKGGVEVDVVFTNHGAANQPANVSTLKLQTAAGQQIGYELIANVTGKASLHDCLPDDGGNVPTLAPGGSTAATAVCFPLSPTDTGPLTLVFQASSTDSTTKVEIPLS